MENGYNTQIDPTSLLLANGFRGGFGGFGSYAGGGSLYTGNSVLAAEAHANGTATKEAIDCNAIRVSDGMDRISDQAEESRRMMEFTSIKDGMTNSEFRNGDRLRDIEREINTNARAADKCCCDVIKAIADAAKDAAQCCCDAKLEAQKNACDTQKLVSAEANATRTLILEVEARGVRDRLEAANAKITQLETINALSGHGHH